MPGEIAAIDIFPAVVSKQRAGVKDIGLSSILDRQRSFGWNFLRNQLREMPTGQMSLSSGLLNVRCQILLFNILSCHHEIWGSKPGSLEQEVEVYPFKHELCHVVHFRILEQCHGTNCWEWIFPGVRLSVVIEIDDVGFPEA